MREVCYKVVGRLSDLEFELTRHLEAFRFWCATSAWKPITEFDFCLKQTPKSNRLYLHMHEVERKDAFTFIQHVRGQIEPEMTTFLTVWGERTQKRMPDTVLLGFLCSRDTEWSVPESSIGLEDFLPAFVSRQTDWQRLLE